MSGDRGYRDSDVISYREAGGQRKNVQRSSSIRTNNARKSNIGNNGSNTRNNEMRRAGFQTNNIRTIHTQRSAAGAAGARSGRAGNSARVSRNGQVRRPYDVRESSQAYRRKKRRRRTFLARFSCAFLICIIAGCAGMGIYKTLFPAQQAKEHKVEGLAAFAENVYQKKENLTIEDIFSALKEEGISCTQDFLTVNEYSRPGDKLKKVNNIFVHYTANPATSAAQNRSYFENLAETHETSASAHFIIGYEGELIQCIPLEEIAYAVAKRNEDSISIECCYLDEDGEFTRETYTTLVHFTAWLLKKYGLEAEDLRRHYDEGGKACPKYYVENEEEWWGFVREVRAYKSTL